MVELNLYRRNSFNELVGKYPDLKTAKKIFGEYLKTPLDNDEEEKDADPDMQTKANKKKNEVVSQKYEGLARLRKANLDCIYYISKAMQSSSMQKSAEDLQFLNENLKDFLVKVIGMDPNAAKRIVLIIRTIVSIPNSNEPVLPSVNDFRKRITTTADTDDLFPVAA